MISGLGVGQHKIGLIISGEGGTNTIVTVNANIMEAGEGRDPVIAVVLFKTSLLNYRATFTTLAGV